MVLTKMANSQSDTFVPKVLDVIAVVTVISYILFSINKRFIENDKFYFVPLFIFSANFLILLELLYKALFKKIDCITKQYWKLFGQIFLNLCFIIYLITFYV